MNDHKVSLYNWDPEKMLEMIMKGQEEFDINWIENGLTKLVDNILDTYEKSDGINHIEGKDLPSKKIIIEVIEDLFRIIFPGYFDIIDIQKSNIKYYVGNILNSCYPRLTKEVEKSLKYICKKTKECPEDVCFKRSHIVIKELFEKIPEIRIFLKGDIEAAYKGDPAAKSIDEVILSYPCVVAITIYRLSHELYLRGVPIIPRIMSEYGHSITGIDIHPGAKIGKNFFIDHGTGVVIGETAEIGDNVKIYQSVTLGALSFPKDESGIIIKGKKRHPTIGNNVIIYSSSTLLGGETIVGNDAVIGGNVWITSSIPSGTKVTIVPPQLQYKEINNTKK